MLVFTIYQYRLAARNLKLTDLLTLLNLFIGSIKIFRIFFGHFIPRVHAFEGGTCSLIVEP